MDTELSMAELTPAKTELEALATKAKAVDLTNLTEVHDTRLMLRDARVALTKTGKALRDGALKFQKDVISKEKELIGIIGPEEERLEKAEDELKLKIEMDKRRDELPSRLDALASIGDDIEVSEEEILKLDDEEFNAYRLDRIDKKLAKDKADHEAKVKADEDAARAKAAEEDRIRREKLEADEKAAAEKRAIEQKKLDDERAEIQREKDRIAAEDKARKEAEEAAEREVQRKEREAAAAKEKAEVEAKEKAEKEQKAREEANFKNWLAKVGHLPSDRIENNTDGSITVWREVGTYRPESK